VLLGRHGEQASQRAPTHATAHESSACEAHVAGVSACASYGSTRAQPPARWHPRAPHTGRPQRSTAQPRHCILTFSTGFSTIFSTTLSTCSTSGSTQITTSVSTAGTRTTRARGASQAPRDGTHQHGPVDILDLSRRGGGRELVDEGGCGCAEVAGGHARGQCHPRWIMWRAVTAAVQ
jgi:hypothetical protein